MRTLFFRNSSLTSVIQPGQSGDDYGGTSLQTILWTGTCDAMVNETVGRVVMGSTLDWIITASVDIPFDHPVTFTPGLKVTLISDYDNSSQTRTIASVERSVSPGMEEVNTQTIYLEGTDTDG
jgi:hypothetical protein